MNIDNRIADLTKVYTEYSDELRCCSRHIRSTGHIILIDSLAQAYAGYSTHDPKRIFYKFLVRFCADEWPFLEWVDPITLYYDMRNHEKEQPGFPLLSCVREACEHTPYSEGFQEQSEELLQYLAKRNSDKLMKYRERHIYANLIYQLRNKLVHEMNPPQWQSLPSAPEFSDGLPFYIGVAGALLGTPLTERIENGETTWHLVIPSEFLESLLFTAMKNYFRWCQYRNMDPFIANYDRNHFLGWYD